MGFASIVFAQSLAEAWIDFQTQVDHAIGRAIAAALSVPWILY
jgi:hypothetical protein